MAYCNEKSDTRACQTETNGIRQLVELPVFFIVAELLLEQTFAISCVCRDWFRFVHCEETLSTIFSHSLTFRTSNTESMMTKLGRSPNPRGPTGGEILNGVARKLNLAKRLTVLRMSFDSLRFGEDQRPLHFLHACIPANLVRLELDWRVTDFLMCWLPGG